VRTAALSGLLIAAMLAPRQARAQGAEEPVPGSEPSQPPTDDLAPLRAPPPRPAETAPPAEVAPEPLDERRAEPEPVIDERRAPEELAEPVCVSCILIGVGTIVLIGAIPLGAKLDGAIRERERLRVWIGEQGGANADLGFIAGYGIAKADQDELTYGVATGLVAGAGAILLGVGVGIVIYQGDFLKNPKERGKAGLDLEALPLRPYAGASNEGVSAGLTGAF
jgi:hypothetical protein